MYFYVIIWYTKAGSIDENLTGRKTRIHDLDNIETAYKVTCMETLIASYEDCFPDNLGPRKFASVFPFYLSTCCPCQSRETYKYK